MDDLVKIWFELDEDWHGSSTETLWAQKVGKEQYRLDNSPFYAKGVSFGDIVTATERDGRLKFNSVVKRGGHSTYRVIVDHIKMPPTEFQKYWDKFSKMACTFEGGPEFSSEDKQLKIYSVDIHPEANLDKVYEYLQSAEDDGIWEFEEGHCYENGK